MALLHRTTIMKSLLTPALLLSLAGPAAAATLSSGSATIDYHKAAWDTLAGGASVPGFEALVLDEFFDQTAANARTSAQILADEVQASPAYGGQVYAMNGITVTNLAGRTAQPTTIDFNPASLTTHTGVIGLGGVTRWDVNALLGGGNVLAGDFTLRYDASRLLAGGSGWALTNNISPAAVVFDLANVTASAGAGTLTISGDLGLSFEVANFLLGSPGDQGKDMGNFTFTGSYVPEPSSALLLAGILGGSLGRRNRALPASRR